ncbi:hypothetical protein [uncultured Polaribacter sp.]|uniref:hypothetical protein n=1 Tax=uncultured Polaribacter sp. TaxID=174711 RepID=UPI002620EA08|nr:hypothetical protein [uncultured Polaribacter sp.]
MNYNSKVSFFGGTFLSSVIHIGVEDFITTIVLAIVGAVVSFIVSVILKYFFQRLKIKYKK